jgi:hypothetical protein
MDDITKTDLYNLPKMSIINVLIVQSPGKLSKNRAMNILKNVIKLMPMIMPNRPKAATAVFIKWG